MSRAAPWAAKTENCFETRSAPQSGQLGAPSLAPTSSSKWHSHTMHTYS